MNNYHDGGINIGLAGKYHLQVIDASTSEIISDYGWRPNLILNDGMDAVASYQIANLSAYGVAGTGNRPNYITSSTSTITQSGAYISLVDYTGLTSFTNSVWTNATQSYTSSVNVGDLIIDQSLSQSMVVLVSGSILYVTGSSLTYTTPKTFTIWKTSQVGLQSENRRTSNCLPGSSSAGWFCGTLISASTNTNRRTFNFAVETLSQSYTEVGCSWTHITNGAVFSRVLLPQPVTLAPQQLLRMTYDLMVTYGPFYPVYRTASITGWPVAPSTNTYGTESLQSFLPSVVNTDGATTGLGDYGVVAIDPYSGTGGFYPFASTINTPLYTGSANTQSAITRPGDFTGDITISPYVNGTYTLTKYGTFSIYQATSSQIYSIGFGGVILYGARPYESAGQAMALVFNQPQTKTNLQTLSLGWRWNWNRVIQ